jgi:acyl-CoA dehydrogenase
MTYAPPLEEHRFALNHVADLEAVSKLNGYQHADPATVATILEEAGRFFAEVMAPLNRVGDSQGSTLDDDGQVRTPTGFTEAYRKFVESGWPGAHLPAEWGGGGLPYLVGVVIQEMFKTANMAFSLCGMLTPGDGRSHPAPRVRRVEGALSGEAGQRGVDRDDESHRVPCRIGRRCPPHQGGETG